MEKYLELLRELCNFEGNFHPSSKRLPLLTTSTAKTISMNTYFSNSLLMILLKRSKCFAFTQNNYSYIHLGFQIQFSFIHPMMMIMMMMIIENDHGDDHGDDHHDDFIMMKGGDIEHYDSQMFK